MGKKGTGTFFPQLIKIYITGENNEEIRTLHTHTILQKKMPLL